MGRPSSHIGEPLRQLRASKGTNVATVCEGRVQTGAGFVDRIAALSTGIRRAGLKPGDRVSIAALNSEWYLEWLLAVPCAGCIIAPLNHRWSVEEASEAIREVGASMLVVDRHCVGWCAALKKSCPSLNWFVYIGSGESPVDRTWTTGRPKGVSLTHTALIVQSEAKLSEVGYSSDDIYLHAATLCHIGGISSALAIVMANGCHILLPKFEIRTAFSSISQYGVSAMIVVPSLVSDMASYYKNMSRSSQDMRTFPSMRTILNGAGSLSQDQLEVMKHIFPSCKIMSAYGMTEACSSMTFLLLHDPDVKATQEVYNYVAAANKTLKVSEGWQTFLRGGVCVGKPPPHVSIGILAMNDESTTLGRISKNFTSMKVTGDENRPSNLMSWLPDIWDTARRRLISVGSSQQQPVLSEQEIHSDKHEGLVTVGRVLTRGPHVMEGYWGRPEKTMEALRADGWLDTGDVGWIDGAGMLWLLGRQKDVIKSGGENVYASEVERLLVKHPAVSSASVVGVPDQRLGESVTAMVRLELGWEWADGSSSNDTKATKSLVSEWSLRFHCQQQGLSRYKVPKYILVQEGPFPVTSTGKVKKDSVRDMAIARLSSKEPRLSSREPTRTSSLFPEHSVQPDSIFIRSRL
ncbi:hypothetical protein R1sor_004930 [Riccia sorocarpa]|uniref:Uncharacterized protein n=1 Tax=Riccia sorocarpa TaxID=122646 RepID=A0ABD3HPK0_9MARC